MTKTISIAEKLSPNLALRPVADDFFDYLQSLESNEIIIDFKDVRFISRAFAHQYVVRKKSSNKIIKEINVPIHVEKMLRIVENPKPKIPYLNLDSIKVIHV